MKSIIYSFIAIFICGIIATGFTGKSGKTNTIILQSADNRISSAILSQSADIISMRLKSFGKDHFDVKTIPGKNEIRVILADNLDMNIIEDLITQKGKMEFYETCNYQSLDNLIRTDSILMKLLHVKLPLDSSASIACIPAAEMSIVNKYLNSTAFNNKARFAWGHLFDKPESCIYALRTENENRILLTGADIQSFELKHDAKWQSKTIAFKFKKEATGIWAEATKRNLHKAIAIVMDNKVIFAPVVTSEITDGNSEISGDFTQTQLRYLAAIGANGELPADFSIVK